MNIPVVVFADHSGRFIAGIESQRGDVTVARHVQELSEVFGLGQTGIARAVLLVSDYEEFLTQSLVSQLHDLGVAVIVIADNDTNFEATGALSVDSLADTDAVIAAIELAVQRVENGEIFTSSASSSQDEKPEPGSGTEVPEQSVDHSEVSEKEMPGKIVAVWGPTGAPGRSTVAINLAATLTSQGFSTVLVDADTYGPAAGIMLGMVDEYSGISQMCHYADRSMLTDDKYREYVSTIEISGHKLDVVSGITRADRWPEVREKPLTSVLQYLSHTHQIVVIDAGFSLEADEEITFDGLAPQRNAATIASIESATDIVVVGSADAIGFPRFVRAIDDLKQSNLNLQAEVKTHIWMNKVRSEATGGRSTAELTRAWERFGPGVPIDGFIGFEPATFDTALLSGKAVIELKDTDTLAQNFRVMAASITTHHTAQGTNAVTPNRQSIFATWKKRLSNVARPA